MRSQDRRDCEYRQVGWQRFDSSDQASSASRTRDHPDRRARGLLGEGRRAVTEFILFYHLTKRLSAIVRERESQNENAKSYRETRENEKERGGLG